MGKHHWPARATAALAGLGLLATGASVPADADGVAYTYPNSKYAKSIAIDNGVSDIVITFTLRRAPASVRAKGWSSDLDTVEGRDTDYGELDFFAVGKWGRAAVNVQSIATDGSYAIDRVPCAGATSTLVGRVKQVTIPRSCLAIDDVVPTAIRATGVVFGEKTTRTGTSCWAVGAPKRSEYTRWLSPDEAPLRAAPTSSAPRTVARGC